MNLVSKASPARTSAALLGLGAWVLCAGGLLGAPAGVLAAGLAGPPFGAGAAGPNAGPNAAPSAAPMPAVRDDRGRVVQLQQPPQRIVSLLPSLTESVCALGACARLVGTDRYSNWPAAVQGLPKVGGLDDAQLESIIRLQPDLVLAATSTRAIARLEQLGLKVLAFDSDQHAQVQSSLTRLGAVLGLQAPAQAAWVTIEADLTRAAERVPSHWHGLSVYFEADDAPYAAGERSFLGQTLARLGLVNIAPATMGPFPKLNAEFVLRAQPQVVMAAQRHAAGMAQRPGWGQLRALARGHVCAFAPVDYELLVRPGPRMGQAALLMADCLARLPLQSAPQAVPQAASKAATQAATQAAPQAVLLPRRAP